ncbi:hypothetical protein SLEP1_g47874 [Rubroshorea leprosula]|uniref:Uncharacterized protein n=1 Tax=Rubroshorea leprosula TaxID=152421 RepID=A0AAV5LUQ3_9ROSI|nr:hypothetical protein SLEP1_g47874 [Rubroshorea leprosula]
MDFRLAKSTSIRSFLLHCAGSYPITAESSARALASCTLQPTLPLSLGHARLLHLSTFRYTLLKVADRRHLNLSSQEKGVYKCKRKFVAHSARRTCWIRVEKKREIKVGLSNEGDKCKKLVIGIVLRFVVKVPFSGSVYPCCSIPLIMKMLTLLQEPFFPS